MLTIFTPTYNRKQTLPKLYESLTKQTNNNFTWLIVDDGSSDGTEELIRAWQTESKIKIEYIYQTNAGKMQAHNNGVLNTKTELFLCVDSDDHLTDMAVEHILTSFEKWKNNDQIAGAVAYKGKDETNPIGNNFPASIEVSTLGDLYKKGFNGDTSLVYRTKILKDFLFPKIDGEKFITENYVYTQIDEKFKLVVIPKIFIICEYLDDGYSKNIYKVFNKNPKGMALYYNLKVSLSKSLKDKFVFSIGYVCYSKIANESNAYDKAKNKIMYLLCFIPGMILYLKRRKF